MFYHGLSKDNRSRGERRVAIVISPNFLVCYEDAGGIPAVHAPDDDANFLCDRCLEITLKLKGMFKVKKGAFREKKLKD